jgi:hypothetical protein
MLRPACDTAWASLREGGVGNPRMHPMGYDPTTSSDLKIILDKIFGI